MSKSALFFVLTSLLAGLTSCTVPNPRSCVNGKICNDPSLPFCDVDGAISGMEQTCIAVDCTPMQFQACRGDSELRCNSNGNNFDVKQCESHCDPASGCEAQRTLFVAFVSDRDGNTEVYRMNPDGTLPANLTNNPAHDDSPFWDPTGEHIAFLSDRNGPVELFVMSPDGSNMINVSHGAAQDAAWSRDGKHLAFVSNRGGAFDLYRVDVDGGNLKPLSSIGNVANPDWSPDGSKIVFTSGSGLQLVKADGSASPVPITTAVDASPRWNLDGSKIAVERRVTFMNYDVFLINPDGSGPTNITNTAMSSDTGPFRWSPDGLRLVGNADFDTNAEVVVVAATGLTYDNLPVSASRDSEPCWSPDGSSVMYTSDRTGKTNIFQVSVAGGTSTNVTKSMSSNNSQCAWRPR